MHPLIKNSFTMQVFCMVVMLTLPSCGKGQVDYGLNDFAHYEPLEFSGYSNEDDLFLGRPQGLAIINDRLVITDYYDRKYLTWATLDLKSFARNVDRGTGPGEISSSATIFRTENPEIVKMQDFSAGRIYSFRWNDMLKGRFSKPIKTDHVGQSRERLALVGDNYVCYDIIDDDRLLFSVVGPDGDIIYRFGEFPGEYHHENPGNRFVRMSLTECMVAANSGGSVFVAGGFKTDFLAFYKLTDQGGSLIKQYFTYSPDNEIKYYNVNGQEAYSYKSNDKTINAYRGLTASEHYLLALYDGTKALSDDKPDYRYLQVFDWDGNFIKGYKLNRRLGAMAFDEKSETLYALGLGEDGESRIYTYRLSGLPK